MHTCDSLAREAALLCRVTVLLGLLLSPFALPQRVLSGAVRATWPETSWLQLASGGFALDAGAIDAAHGYAYLGSDLNAVLRVHVPEWAYAGSVPLDAGQIPTSMAVDVAGDCLYVTTASSTDPGQLVKIGLIDFTQVATITLGLEEGAPASVVVDHAGGYAYFGTDSEPGRVIKVDLTSFSRVATLTLEAGEGGLRTAVLDRAAGYAYFGTYTSPGRIVRIRLSDFSRVFATPLEPDTSFLTSVAFDESTGHAYLGTDTFPGKIVKVRLSDLIPVATLTLDAGGEFAGGLDDAFVADGHAYFSGLDANYGSLLKVIDVNLADFSWAATLTVLPSVYQTGGPYWNYALPGPALYDPITGRGFFGITSWQYDYYAGVLTRHPAEMVGVDLAGLTLANRRYPGEGGTSTAALDASGFVYYGLETGHILKLRRSDFARVTTLIPPYDGDVSRAAFVEPGGEFGYFLWDSTPVRIARIRLADLTEVGMATLASGENGLHSAAFDPVAGIAYIGTASGQIVRVRLADLVRLDALNLGDDPRCAALDAAGGTLYFGLASGGVARVDLPSFSLAGTLSLGTEALVACVVDPYGGYAYFAHARVWDGMDVDRVRLADFVPAGTVAIPSTWYGHPKEPQAAALDMAGGLAYWSSVTIDCFCTTHCQCWRTGFVDCVALETFTQVTSVEIGPAGPQSMVLDLEGNAGYLGSSTLPGRVLSIALPAAADLQANGSAAPGAVLAGQPFTYTLAATNLGLHGASHVVLTATLPTGVAFGAASPGCAHAGGVVTCMLPDLRARASTSVTVGVTTDGALPAGPLVATLAVAGTEPDQNPANNTASITVTVVAPRAHLPLVAWQGS